MVSTWTIRASVASALAALVAAGAVAPAPAAAADGMEVALADDGVFLFRTYYRRARAFDQARPLATTRIHAMLPWTYALRRRQSRRRHAPRHPVYYLQRWDDLIDAAARRGIRVELVLSGKAPAFATSNHKIGRKRPDARRFGQFARAMAAHFKGRVDRYSIWNEPNYVSWLKPMDEAPGLYRRLYRAGYAAIKRADPRAQVLIGETSPRDSPGRSVAPLAFLRRVACVDRHYRPVRHCPTLRADGYAQHPYEFQYPPNEDHADADDVTIGTLDHLTNALDRLRSADALVAPGRERMGVHLTEFGYFASGRRKISAKRAARYLPQAFEIAQNNNRVREMTQYGLVVPPKRHPAAYFNLGIVTLKGHLRRPYRTLADWAAEALEDGDVRRPAGRIALPPARRSGDSPRAR
ncbi:MAG TPA: hypothetical protein VJT75_05865 [Thermoleophilaceae bacterium]|nr:hypothetical protein [Thermoleophilaceae bacterium]